MLESNPGAGKRLFLDFDGHFQAAWSNFSDIDIPAYDVDGDPNAFSDAELLNIVEIWRRVSEDYAPFDLNVTTLAPETMDDGADLRVAIGGDGAWSGAVNGGISITGLFTSPVANVVFVFPDNLAHGNARFVAESISHESGHAYGLDHQALYDASGNLIDEYNPGDPGRGPIMGDSYHSDRGVWWRGPTEHGADELQEDLEVLAATIGWRGDDVGDDAASATPMAVNNAFVSGGGIIGKMDDVDVWSFDTDDGVVMFQVSVPAGINNLDAKMRLFDADGNLAVDWQDPAGSYDAFLVATLTSGSYRLAVGSHGAYGDVGQYLISGVVIPPGSVLAAPTDLIAVAVSPTKVELTWDDNADDETGYFLEQTTDGEIWHPVAQLEADSTYYANTDLTPGTFYHYRASAIQGIYLSEFSNVASALTWPAMPMGPSDLEATAISSSQIHLAWTDNAGNETGYVVEQSVDGVAWIEIAALPADATSFDIAGLDPSTTYLHRVRAMNGVTASDDSNLSSTATPPATPDAPTQLSVAVVANHQIVLSWIDNANVETGYTIERSPDGVTWSIIANVPAGSTSYADGGLQPSRAYYYRVTAVNDAVSSESSNVAIAVTRPNPPPAPWGLKAFSTTRNMLLLSWNDYSGRAQWYKILRSTNGVNWTPVGYTAAATKSFRVARPGPGRTYYFAIVGINAGGESTASNVLLVKPNSVFRAASLKSYSGKA